MSERETVYIDVRCIIRAVTAKAFRIEIDVGEFHWLPRSVCANGQHEFDVGGVETLKIATWFAQKNGIEATEGGAA